jgi:NAD(P)-dependent dehydrogenase (short-subunit alcohol dehydrogenase family)
LGIRANPSRPARCSPPPATESAWAHQGGTRDAPPARIPPARIPLGRVGTPEDIAWCAVYLACDEAARVTGGNLPVDGGVMAG